jgi:hypothetical protein
MHIFQQTIICDLIDLRICRLYDLDVGIGLLKPHLQILTRSEAADEENGLS